MTSKRVTLTNDDIALILTVLEESTRGIHGSSYVAANQRKQQLIDKLKTEPSSQKVSSSSDKTYYNTLI